MQATERNGRAGMKKTHASSEILSFAAWPPTDYLMNAILNTGNHTIYNET